MKVVQINWEEKKELVESGEIDCIMGCFSMEGRLDDYRWAGPYIASRQVVAVNENSDIYKLSDLEGKNLAKERPDYKQNRRQILADIETQAKALLAQMGLSDRENHYPHQLSGGQQQRVAIARALALHPDILCFDEPTSALDPELTGEVLRVLRELAEHKTTMIIVTHEMKFARDAADRILFMDGGVVVEQGDAKELIDHPKEERTRQFLASYGK